MIRFDADALYAALDKRRRERRVTWRVVASEAGVVPSTLTRLGLDGQLPNAHSLLRLLVWVGETDVQQFIEEAADADQS